MKITEEAGQIVDGDRQKMYGHPADDFARTAGLWTELLRPKLGVGCSVTAEDVPRMMIALKLSRDVNFAQRDNLVDIAGYAETLQMVRDKEILF